VIKIGWHFEKCQPIFLLLRGSGWRFATLVGTDYCLSRKFDAENKKDLIQILFVLKQIKQIMLNR
jgi:hypothetical protein